MFNINRNDVYFMSDPHYSHKNMCRGVSEWPVDKTRDFKTVDQMNDAIVKNINDKVGNGLLICLGDWNFNGISNLPIFRNRLTCEVGLILGNHDGQHGKCFDPVVGGRKSSSYFSFYERYMEVVINGQYFVLFHYPIASWNHMSKGSIHLFGHCHSPKETKFFNGGKSMDVGLDGNDLMPYSFNEIMEIMESRPVKREGHH